MHLPPLKYTLLFLCGFLVFSCHKKTNDAQPIGSGQTGDWVFTEKDDGGGTWKGSGCAVNSYYITKTNVASTKYDGILIRYFADGTVSRFTEVDSLTGLPASTYITYEYGIDTLSGFRLYEPSTSSIMYPVDILLSYTGSNLTHSVEKVGTKGASGNKSYEGYLSQNSTYTYGTNSLTIESTNDVNVNQTTNGVTVPYTSSNPSTKTIIQMLNNDLNWPTQIKRYTWQNATISFSGGYGFTFDANGNLIELDTLMEDNSKTVLRKYYWDVSKPLNKEANLSFILNDPFFDRYKLFPEELSMLLSSKVKSYTPVKVEEYIGGNLSNTMSIACEFDIQNKLTKLTITQTKDAKKEEHVLSYTCN